VSLPAFLVPEVQVHLAEFVGQAPDTTHRHTLTTETGATLRDLMERMEHRSPAPC
jgi:hypothetical protein